MGSGDYHAPMIPDLAVIVSVYAVARLLLSYVLVGEQQAQLRLALAIIAIGIIVLFTVSIVSASGSLNI
jgi:hypothetical protein